MIRTGSHKVTEFHPPPHIPRDRVLAPGGLFWLVMTVGSFLWGAGYLLVKWICS